MSRAHGELVAPMKSTPVQHIVLLGTVHLRKKLRFLLLVRLGVRQFSPSTDGTDLIEEDDGGLRLAGLLEHEPGQPCAVSDPHANQITCAEVV